MEIEIDGHTVELESLGEDGYIAYLIRGRRRRRLPDDLADELAYDKRYELAEHEALEAARDRRDRAETRRMER